MLKKKLFAAIKRHPIAITLFVLYVILWAALCYLTFYYLNLRDGETIEAIVFYTFVLVCVPYLAMNVWYASFSETDPDFYRELCFFIAVPMLVVAFIYMAHYMISYGNSGV